MTAYRMAGEDCAMVRVYEDSMMAMQIAWLYDRPVDMDQLAVFHTRLQRGRMGRVVAPALRFLGAAGDRWTARAQFAPLAVEPNPIARSKVDEWLRERADDDLSSCGGPAWRLAVTELDDGGTVVSLVVSHIILDGRSMCQAIVEAVSDTGPDWTYATDHYGTLRLAMADARAAVRQFLWAAGCYTALMSGFGWRALVGKPLPGARIGPPRTQVPEGGFEPAPVAQLAMRLAADQWREASAARGGTPTTLAVAIVADLAMLMGRVDDQGRAVLMMPISMRKDLADPRGNVQSSATVLAEGDNRFEDLRPLRAEMKKAFQGAKAQYRVYRLGWPVAMLYPRPRLQYSRRNQTPDLVSSVCSVVGEVDPLVSRIDGHRADSVLMGLAWHHDRDLTQLTANGGLLRGAMAQIEGEVVLRVSAMHPSAPLTEDELRTAVTKVAESYGLSPSFW